MILENIHLGAGVSIHETTSVNNVRIGDNTRIAKHCSIFGSRDNPLEIGKDSYVGLQTVLNGYAAKVRIGSNCSIAQNVNVMTDSGPNASKVLQSIFPIEIGPVQIGDHCWIGAGVTIMPNVSLGNFSVVAAHSFVNQSFEPYSILGGTPAKLIRRMTDDEIKKLSATDVA
jgi:acetyltransferase-like isoleucine patch superfamily enzyme